MEFKLFTIVFYLLTILFSIFYLIDHKWFQQNFDKWTSGNEFIDKFIQESQLSASLTSQILEWISYNRFKNIEYFDKGGFSTIYKAIWLDGPINYWSDDKKNWIRSNKEIVALKSLDKSSNLNEEFLNEVCNQYFVF